MTSRPSGVSTILLEIGKSRNQFANYPRGEHRPAQCREAFREPLPRHVIREKRQVLLRREHFNRSDFREGIMSELRDLIDTLAQRNFEIG
jgi:hypothetical protein